MHISQKPFRIPLQVELKYKEELTSNLVAYRRLSVTHKWLFAPINSSVDSIIFEN
jgi:hypothetical protein